MKKITETFQLCNLLYAILLLLLTFYNYHKLVYENYCIDTRPGNIDSDLVYFNVGALMTLWSSVGYWEPKNLGKKTDITLYRYKDRNSLTGSLAAQSFMKGGANDTLIMSKCLFNTDSDGASHLNLFYKAQDKFFNLSCSNRGYNSTDAKYLTLTQEGLLLDGGLQRMSGDNPVFSCRVTIFENECSMKKTVGETYLIITVFVIILFFSLYLMVILFDPVKEFFHIVLKMFGKDMSFMNYCNPLNNGFGSIKKGEDLYMLSTVDNLKGDKIDHFSSSNVKILLKKHSIMIKTLGVGTRESSQLSDDQVQNLGKFLMLLFERDENWVSNGIDHYLSTDDFIEGLNEGLFVAQVKAEKHLKLKSNTCVKMLSNIKKWSESTIQILAEHNKKFFGECRDDVLIAVHEHKTSWYERPFGVGNSQWKRYCSDVSNILLKNGDDFVKTQYNKPICLTQTARDVLSEFKPEINKPKEEELITIPPIFKNKDLDDLSRTALTPILNSGYEMLREKGSLRKAEKLSQGREMLTKFVSRKEDLDYKILGEEIIEVLEESKIKLQSAPNVRDYRKALSQNAELYKRSNKSVKREMQKREDFPLILDLVKSPDKTVFLKESTEAVLEYNDCLTFAKCVAEQINVEQTVQNFRNQIKTEVKKQEEVQIKSDDVFKMVLLKNKRTKVFRPDKAQEKVIDEKLCLLNKYPEDQNYYKCLNNVQNINQYRRYCYNKEKVPKGGKRNNKQGFDWVCAGIKKSVTKSRNIDLDMSEAFKIFEGKKEWENVSNLSEKKKKSESEDNPELGKEVQIPKNKPNLNLSLPSNKFNTQHMLDFGKGIHMYKYITEKINKKEANLDLKGLIEFRKLSSKGLLARHLYLGIDVDYSKSFNQILKPFESFVHQFT